MDGTNGGGPWRRGPAQLPWASLGCSQVMAVIQRRGVAAGRRPWPPIPKISDHACCGTSPCPLHCWLRQASPPGVGKGLGCRHLAGPLDVALQLRWGWQTKTRTRRKLCSGVSARSKGCGEREAACKHPARQYGGGTRAWALYTVIISANAG